MAHLFVSYSRKNREAIRRLVDTLVAAGHRVWTDQDIPGGDLWRTRIVEAIGNADAFIVVLSQESIKSDNVRKELGIAENNKRRIFPVVIERVSVPRELEYQLEGVQIIDLTTEPNAGEKRLLDSIQLFCEPKEQPSVTRAVNLLSKEQLETYSKEEREKINAIMADPKLSLADKIKSIATLGLFPPTVESMDKAIRRAKAGLKESDRITKRIWEKGE